MNFLAHTVLSPPEIKVMLGNLSGDFVKGKSMLHLDPLIAKGAQLHRSIDSFTDSHPLTRSCKRIISTNFGLYSGIIIDMFFDHFLAKNWKKHDAIAYENHISIVHNSLVAHHNVLPENFKEVYPYLINQNWLLQYSSRTGLEVILTQMSNRIKKRVSFENSMQLLSDNELELETMFLEFWRSISNEFETFNTNPLKLI